MRQDGFTLIEVLVSLAIFSLAIVGLNRAAGLAVNGAAELTARTHAGFAADNAVVLSKSQPLDVGTVRTEAASGGLVFDVATTTAATELPGFFEITVAVSDADGARIIATRRAFRAEALPDIASGDPLDEDAPDGEAIP